jgi:hypothetical protein
VAELELRLYVNVDYPLEQQRLDATIRLTEAELASYPRRLAEYRQFTKFKHSSPLFHSLEIAQLAREETALRLKNLKAEKSLLRRYYGDRRRLYELRVEIARAKLQALQSSQ